MDDDKPLKPDFVIEAQMKGMPYGYDEESGEWYVGDDPGFDPDDLPDANASHPSNADRRRFARLADEAMKSGDLASARIYRRQADGK